MTLLLICAAVAVSWVLASTVAAVGLGRMLQHAEAAEAARLRGMSQLP